MLTISIRTISILTMGRLVLCIHITRILPVSMPSMRPLIMSILVTGRLETSRLLMSGLMLRLLIIHTLSREVYS